MKKFYYISPSILPSRSANSVHVVNQCLALIDLDFDVYIFAKRSINDKRNFEKEMLFKYGFKNASKSFITFFSKFNKADNLKIAIMSINYLRRVQYDGFILSRNLYAAFWLSVIKSKPIIYETHMLEVGFRKLLQRKIIIQKNVRTIVISKKLKDILANYHNVSAEYFIVLHDAAKEVSRVIDLSIDRSNLINIVPEAKNNWRAICGYFGHLYKGRGIEVIISMAKERKEVLFIVVGGNQADILQRQKENMLKNILFIGHLDYLKAQSIMRSVDILLMPYQKNVSIGLSGQDTAKYMSPMKMFEYMSTGNPIISSNLPVLREILEDQVNSLLVKSSSVEEWLEALDKVIDNPRLRKQISANAFKQFERKHTWTIRSKAILNVLRTMGLNN